jgi:outer membrane protein OmpA-like peptidoglycan-associated protein
MSGMMNQKINSILIALVALSYFISAIDVYAEDRSPESKEKYVIYFKSSTFEIDDKTIDDIFLKLDQGKKYLIQGYACSSGEKREEYLLAEAEKRAEIVREYLIKRGFSSNKLSTIAYDHNSECIVILKAIE